MEKELTASELAGEIKRMARLYDVFRRADDVAQMLVESEQRKTQLKKDIDGLEKEKETLDSKINKNIEEGNKKVDDLGKMLEKKKEEIKAAEEKAASIVAKAKSEAFEIVSKAKAEVLALTNQMASDMDAAMKARRAKEQAKAEMDAMVSEVQRKKKELLEAFS